MMTNLRCTAMLALGLLGCSFAAHAESSRGESLADQHTPSPLAYKFTGSLYSTSDDNLAADFNLRANLGNHTMWAGLYRSETGFQQGRIGYENSSPLPFGRLVSSAQLATRGFVGGSVTAEIGTDNFLLLGLGRTNLRDYYNLTFDPNDSVVYGIGSRTLIPKTTAYLFSVKDNRLDTGQCITHLVIRVEPKEGERWTFDLFQKSGQGDGEEPVKGTGLGITYDFAPYFVRLARDPHVNFSQQNMLRLSGGFRF